MNSPITFRSPGGRCTDCLQRVQAASERGIIDHHAVQMVRRHIRDGPLFRDNAAGQVGPHSERADSDAMRLASGTYTLSLSTTSAAVGALSERAAEEDLVVRADIIRWRVLDH